MKRFLILSATLLLAAFQGKAQQSDTLPQGPMSLNHWGKLSVDGVVIEKELWDRYFSAEELADFKSGNTMRNIGGIVASIGAFPMGYGLGYTLGWRSRGGPTDHPGYKTAQICLWAGLGVMVAGLAVAIPGSIKMNRVIKNYNTSLSYQPKLHWGNTENGIGLAFVF